jgi:hypothetical protein
MNAVKEETRMSRVLLINAFEIPEDREEECLAFWEKAAEYMRRQPGFFHPAAPGHCPGGLLPSY